MSENEHETKDRPREVWEACTVQCYLQGRKERAIS
jgi:hypothetical protein